MDRFQYSDISAKEDTFDSLPQEDGDDSYTERYDTLDYGALESLGLRSHHVEDRYQHVGFQSSQPSTSLLPRDSAVNDVQCSDITEVSTDETTFYCSSQEDSDDSDEDIDFKWHSDVMANNSFCLDARENYHNFSSLLQDQSQTALMFDMPEIPQLLTRHAVIILPEGVPSSEADAHTAVASTAVQQDMEHQSSHQQLCSELTIPHPLPHTSMTMQNRELLTILEERNSPSREGLVESQSTEPNLQQMSRLEQNLTKPFSKMRNMLDSTTDGSQYSGISDVSVDENASDWPSREDSDETVAEINVVEDYAALDTRLSQLVEGACQGESSECSLPSTSLPASEIPATTEALLQIQVEDYAALDTRLSQLVEGAYQGESSQCSLPSTSLPPSELPATEALLQNQVADYAALDTRLLSQLVEGACQGESSQCSLPSTSLPASEIPATTEALLQNQVAVYVTLDSILLCQLVEGAYQVESSQCSVPSTSLPASELPATTEALLQNQVAVYAALDSRLLSQLVVGAYQGESSQCSLPSTSLPPSELPATTEALLQNQLLQDHSQRALMDNMPQNPQFRTYDEALILPDGVPSSEPDAHTAVASKEVQQDMENQSRQQQLCSELLVPSFSLPLDHASMPMQNPEPLTIPEERNSPLREDLVESQSIESNPPQICSLEEIQKFAETFKKIRNILGFTKEHIRLVFMKRSRKYIEETFLSLFEDFSVVFGNMCHMKTLYEHLQKVVETSRRASYSSDNESKFVDCSRQEHETIATKKQQQVGEDDGNQAHPSESVSSTVSDHGFSTNKGVKDVRRHTGNEQSRYTAPQLNYRTRTVSSLLSQNMVAACQFLQSQPKQMISLEEMKEFVANFKKWRNIQKFTKEKIISELEELCRIKITENCIDQFKRFNAFVEKIYEMKPTMEEWLKDIHISETQGRIFEKALQESFKDNRDPNAEKISILAKSLKLDNALVTIWFQKRRQIEDCIDILKRMFTDKDKENICRVLLSDFQQFINS